MICDVMDLDYDEIKNTLPVSTAQDTDKVEQVLQSVIPEGGGGE